MFGDGVFVEVVGVVGGGNVICVCNIICGHGDGVIVKVVDVDGSDVVNVPKISCGRGYGVFVEVVGVVGGGNVICVRNIMCGHGVV